MAYAEKQLLLLIGEIYDASLRTDRWHQFAQSYVDIMRADSIFLRLNGNSPGETEFLACIGFDPHYMKTYREYYYEIDTYRRFFQQIPIGVVEHDAFAIARADRVKTEYYNDFMRPQDKHHGAGGCIARIGTRSLAFAMQRGRRRATFTRTEMDFAALLFPHIARAFQIHRHTQAMGSEHDATQSVLDRLAIAVLLVDSNARPVVVNAAAEEMLVRANVLRLERGLLVTNSAHTTSRLRQFIASAGATSAERAPHSGGALPLKANAEQYNVLVTPIGAVATSQMGATPGAHAAVFITPSERERRLPLDVLMQLHDFTRAEAKLASSLATGASLAGVAQQFGISKHTARAQLKSVFRKTETSRQGELVAHLLATVPLQKTNVDAAPCVLKKRKP